MSIIEITKLNIIAQDLAKKSIIKLIGYSHEEKQEYINIVTTQPSNINMINWISMLKIAINQFNNGIVIIFDPFDKIKIKIKK